METSEEPAMHPQNLSRNASFALAMLLALTACEGQSEDEALADLDNILVTNATDPALNSALQDQILVDPTLSQQSNRNSVRTPAEPVQAQYPGGERLTDGGCAAGKFDYAPAWAERFPAPFTVYPGSQLEEAAANNDGDCRMRVATFMTSDSAERVLVWYRARATQSGYSAEQHARGGDHVLAGANEQDGGAYYLIVTPGEQGSEVALITNNGV